MLGILDGGADGLFDGDELGAPDGCVDGMDEGESDGASDGSIEGSKVFGNRRSMMDMDYIIFSNESGVDKLFIAGNHVLTWDNSLDTYGLICIDQDFIPYW